MQLIPGADFLSQFQLLLLISTEAREALGVRVERTGQTPSQSVGFCGRVCVFWTEVLMHTATCPWLSRAQRGKDGLHKMAGAR